MLSKLSKINPTVTTIVAAGALALALTSIVNLSAGKFGADGMQVAPPASAQTAETPAAPWAASATGRVEPKGGEVRIASQVPGKIVEVLASTNDAVKAGDLLVRLDDADLYAKIAAAKDEVGVRVREREEEKATGIAQDRRNAVDAVAQAERALFNAREAFDASLRALKTGSGKQEDVDAARAKVKKAQEDESAKRAALVKLESDPTMPLEQRLESSLSAARAELASYEIALERTRVRAPSDGTVLNMLAKVGETTVPSPESAVVVFGDLTSLQLRAEVEERDAAKVRVGQGVVVKADAYPDKEFTGVVRSISPSLASPRIASRGPRRPNDVEVVEVMVDLDGNPPLLTGMRVDTYFKNEAGKNDTAAAPKTN